MFKCKVCSEKDQRIAELKEQIQYFKSVLNPEPKRTYQLAHDEREQEMIMDGGGREEIDLETERKMNEQAQRESDFIFSGNSELSETGS